LPQHIFYAFSCHFHVLIEKTSFVGFSIDTFSADDEQQPQINLIHRFCTRTIDSSKGMLLPR
jgi:hypothetical protein